MRRIGLVVLLLGAGGAAGLWWWFSQRTRPATELVLYGNVDLRQVQLAFNNNERIAEVLVREGARVRPKQVLARLDTSRLEPQLAQVEAMMTAQSHALDRLRNGSRPEEIAQARAQLRLQEANLTLARANLARAQELQPGGAISKEEVDQRRQAVGVSEANLNYAQETLRLAELGPRKEDIDQAAAQLSASQAQLALLRQQLADAELLAPCPAVVRTRLLEPGEMVTPQKPVFTLAITDPKWVRAYVSEPDLGKVRPGLSASIMVDSFPQRRFDGWVGFISPVAEFTPKAVQTEELRTSLVYEVRVFVKDPGDELRLGMPATVHLPLEPAPPAPGDPR
jgi:HlyD family secretion protein